MSTHLLSGLLVAIACSTPAFTQCASWDPAFGLPGNGIGADVVALKTFDDGSGPALYAGGFFSSAGGTSANAIAKWNGTHWSALGSGMDDTVGTLDVFDDGSGAALYAGGSFTFAGGSSANRIAKWNGTSWSALGSGMNARVFTLRVFDDGSGPALFAGGSFTTAGGASASRVAKWNGTSWSALGSGMNDTVYVLEVFDDGSGPALYAGGPFTLAGGIGASRIAKWNGTTWSALGSGTDNSVIALRPFDDGAGPALYAGGSFTTAGGTSANRVAKWDGSNWSALGSGTDNAVDALAVFDDGSGPALHAGGGFSTAGGTSASRIAKWNGTSWSALGTGITGTGVYTLEVFNDGKDADDDLFAGGHFGNAGGFASLDIAEWHGCGTTSFCFGDGSSGPCPCTNNGAAAHGCENSSSTGGAILSVAGVPSLASDSVLFNASGEKPTALSILAQGDTQIAAVAFGQGLRCVSGNLKRLYVEHAVGGAFSAPTGAEPKVHVRSATLGDAIPAGSPRYYYAYYRDATVLGGCSSTSTFNATQSMRLIWTP